MAGNINIPASTWARDRLMVECEWPRALVDLDLTYWADPKACEGRKRPSYRVLADTWGWKPSRAYRLLKREAAPEQHRSTGEAEVKQGRSTGDGANADNGDESKQDRSTGEAEVKQDRSTGEAAHSVTHARTSPSPSPSPSLNTETWTTAHDAYQTARKQMGLNASTLKRSKGMGAKLNRAAKADLPRLLRVLTWWSTSNHDRAVFIRGKGCTLQTVLVHLEEYDDMAQNPGVGGQSTNGRGEYPEPAPLTAEQREANEEAMSIFRQREQQQLDEAAN